MTQPIEVDLPHRLGKAAAKQRIESGFGKLAGVIPGGHVAEHHWSGDTLNFVAEGMGQRVAVRLDVLGDVVEQEVIRAVLARLGGQLLVVEERDAQEVGEHPTEEVRELLRLYEERVTAMGRQAARARLHRGADKARAEGGRAGGRRYGPGRRGRRGRVLRRCARRR